MGTANPPRPASDHRPLQGINQCNQNFVMIHGPSRSVEGHGNNTPLGSVDALTSRNGFNQDDDLESLGRRIMLSLRAIIFDASLAIQTCTWMAPYCVAVV